MKFKIGDFVNVTCPIYCGTGKIIDRDNEKKLYKIQTMTTLHFYAKEEDLKLIVAKKEPLTLKFIKTMDFQFDDVIILNCKDIKELENRIKENEVIEIDNDGEKEYLNSSYIMYFG